MVYHDLRTTLSARVPYPETLVRLMDSGGPWKEFCALPEDVKNRFGDHPKREGGPLYVNRTTSPKKCIGEYLHLSGDHAENERFFSACESAAGADPAFASFRTYASDVVTQASQYARDIALAIGDELPAFRGIIDRGEYKVLVRFLHYIPEGGVPVYTEHYDRGFLALHLYESAPALEILGLDMHWRPVGIQENESVVFCGMQMEELSRGTLQKAWHRVVNPDDADRYSIVLFIWSDSLPRHRNRAGETPGYQPVV